MVDYVNTKWEKIMKNILDRVIWLKGSKTVSEFASVIGMHPQTVDNYLTERRKISLSFIDSVCRNCNVSADWLLGYSTERMGTAAPVADVELAKEVEKLKEQLKEKDCIIQGMKMALEAVGKGKQ